MAHAGWDEHEASIKTRQQLDHCPQNNLAHGVSENTLGQVHGRLLVLPHPLQQHVQAEAA